MKKPLEERKFRPGLHRFAVLSCHLPKAIPGAQWVDLGGGAGEFAVLAAKHGYHVTLVDEDDRNLRSAESRNINGVLANLNSQLCVLQNAEFEGASLIEVVEHIPLAEQLMHETFRILKPGGLLLLSTPNAVWWRSRLRILFGRPLEAEGYHYRFFTVKGVRRLCENAGFRIVRMHFSTPAFGYNWIVRRLLGRNQRKHVNLAQPFAGLLAQTMYVVAVKPS